MVEIQESPHSPAAIEGMSLSTETKGIVVVVNMDVVVTAAPVTLIDVSPEVVSVWSPPRTYEIVPENVLSPVVSDEGMVTS